METIFEAALDLQNYCDEHGWHSCFIGGIAVQRWGEVRVTRDADLTLLTGFGAEVPYVETLLAKYTSRHPDPLRFARTSRVLLLNSAGGIGLDISLGALPFEERMIARATPFEFSPGLVIRTCSAEDLLILKLFASRPLDLRDAEGIVLRHTAELDWQYIEEQLLPLAEAKEDPEILRTLDRLRG